MNQKWILVCGLISISFSGFCQDNTGYISLYKGIAITEMMRTGIPASITLAQAMIESNCGKSELASKTNNHFGIKCGNNWRGKCYNVEDDDYEDGKLIKSCFREFPTVNDSYIAHSDFLTDPAKANRYSSLFKLESTDYKGWAVGLSRAGYATDPQYAKRLIDIIEKFKLYDLDSDADIHEPLVSAKPTRTSHIIRYENEVKYVLVAEGDDIASLAAKLDVKPRQLVRYNDDINNENQALVVGTYVYIQPKRNKYISHQQYYLLKPEDDLVAISQKYGIKISALLKRNHLSEGQTPLPNQKLVLRGKLKKELLIADPYRMPKEEIKKETNETVSSNVDTEMIQTNHITSLIHEKVDSVSTTTARPVSAPPSHIVSKGETLFGIAQSHGLSLTELKKMNNLSVDTIYIGQKLVVK